MLHLPPDSKHTSKWFMMNNLTTIRLLVPFLHGQSHCTVTQDRHSQPDFETTSENRYLITIVLHVGHRSLEYLVRDRRTCLYRAAPRSQEPKTLRTSSSSLSSPTDEHEFMKAHAGTVLCLLSFGATLGHATEH
jgi:hydroxyacyl-ACP dehydratase HTD2-like protein with hotdog domain